MQLQQYASDQRNHKEVSATHLGNMSFSLATGGCQIIKLILHCHYDCHMSKNGGQVNVAWFVSAKPQNDNSRGSFLYNFIQMD